MHAVKVKKRCGSISATVDVKCDVLSVWVTTCFFFVFFSMPKGFAAGPPTCPRLHTLIKLFKRKPSFKTPPYLPFFPPFSFFFFFFFFFSFFVVKSAGQLSPPTRRLSGGKEQESSVLRVEFLKMHALPLNTHCHSLGSRLSPSCGGDDHRQIKPPRRVMTCMTTACMHAR